MIIDIVVIILLVLSLFKGLKNGLVIAVFSFLAFLIGLAAALKLSAVVAAYLGAATHIGERWLPFIAFGLIFIIVVLLVRLAARALQGLLQVAMLGWLNRIGGVLFYALLYLFIFSILLFYGVKLQLLKPETIAGSISWPYLEPLGPGLVSALAFVLPFLKNVFTELTSFFDQLAQQHS